MAEQGSIRKMVAEVIGTFILVFIDTPAWKACHRRHPRTAVPQRTRFPGAHLMSRGWHYVSAPLATFAIRRDPVATRR